MSTAELEQEQDRPTSMWRLAKAGSGTDISSSGSSSDENDGVFVYVNGRRARSKRTGKVYGQISGIKRKNSIFEVKTSDWTSLRMPVEDLDTESLGQELGINISLDNLENPMHPLLHSTPFPTRKRQKSGSNTTNPDSKYKGCVEVPLSPIKRAPAGFTLIEGNSSKVESFKSELRTNPHHHIPVLPVMVQDENWDEDKAEDAEYFLPVLGGYSLWEAIMDLSDDERFAHYQRCMVKVHAGLSDVEALEVGALFQQHQTLLRDEIPDLQAKVNVCRRLLYSMHDLDEDVNEPPSTRRTDWYQNSFDPQFWAL